MKKFLIVLVLCAAPLLLWGQRSGGLPLLEAKKDGSGKYGYFDEGGNNVMPCIFDMALSFGRSDYVSVVKGGDRYYVIDRLGNLFVRSSFDTMPDIYGNIMLLGNYGERYVADMSGRRLSPEGWNVEPLTSVGSDEDPVLFNMNMVGDKYNVHYLADLNFRPFMKKEVNRLKSGIYCSEVVEYGINDTGSGYVCGVMNAAGEPVIEGDSGWSMDVKPLSCFTKCDEWIGKAGMYGLYGDGEKDMTVFVMFSHGGKSKIYDITGQLVVPLQNGTNISKLLDKNFNKYLRPYLHRVTDNTNRYAEHIRKPYEECVAKSSESDVMYRMDGAVAVADVIAGRVDLDSSVGSGAGAAVSGKGAAVAAGNATSRLGEFASGSGGESAKSAEDKVIKSISDFFSSVDGASGGSGSGSVRNGSTSDRDEKDDGVQGFFDMAAAMSGATVDKSSGNRTGGGSGSVTVSYTAEECYRRGMDAMEGKDLAAAAQWLEQAAAKGCAEACRPLAECYDLTSSPVYDESKAAIWYMTALENSEEGSYDFWYSCYRLAFYCEFGKGGMDRDLEQARALFVLSRDNTYADNRATMDDCIARVEEKIRAERGSGAVKPAMEATTERAATEGAGASETGNDAIPDSYDLFFASENGGIIRLLGDTYAGSNILMVCDLNDNVLFTSNSEIEDKDGYFIFHDIDDNSVTVKIKHDWSSVIFKGTLYDMSMTRDEMEAMLKMFGK